jgi:thiol-disulfide isomerase/thioredoxin
MIAQQDLTRNPQGSAGVHRKIAAAVGRSSVSALLLVVVFGIAAAVAAAPALQTASGATGKSSKAPAAQKAPGAKKERPLEVIDAERFLALVTERRGKPLMVTLWATWCEPCRDEYPMVNELVRQYQPKGLAVFGMSLDDDAEETLALHFLARNHPVFPNYRKKPGREEEFINRVNPRWSGALPATFFYAPDGRLLGQIVGEQPREVFVSAIEQLLALSARK